jgi:branched-chain amino acid transport system permease protein
LAVLLRVETAMTTPAEVGYHAAQHARWRPSEVAFWIFVLACAFLFPSRYLIMTDIVRIGLFALSLDLLLGYSGIVSLGHAAFFGVGAYSAGLFALHGIINEPVIALIAAGLVAMALGFVTSFLVIRGADLTRLMVTLGIALLLEALAERYSDITGGTDGLQGIEMQPIIALFPFDIFGKTGFFYTLSVLFLLFLLARRVVHSPFGLSLLAIKNNRLRAAAIGIPVGRRLVAIYTLAAFYAGMAGALFTQTTALASLDVFAFERSADLLLVLIIGGSGYLYGGLIGAAVFRLLQELFSTMTPQYWQFWTGLVLVLIVLVGRRRLHRWALWVPNLAIRQGGDCWRRMGTRADVNSEIAEVLARFDLLDVMNDPTATLPYGKQRLLEIAIAIAAKPRVLLLDEPAAGVPERDRENVLAAVAGLPRDVTVLLIEHDMDLVFAFADRISVLVNGELLVEGAPDEVARDPRVKAAYLGEAADA